MQRTRGAGMALLALCLAFFASANLAGQDQAADREAPRRLMLAVRQADAGVLTDEELAVISRSMLLALQEARADLVMVEPARKGQDPSDDGMSRLAEESGADCWMLVEISGAEGELVFNVRSRDVLNGSTVIDATVRRQAAESISVMSLPYERWDDLSALLSGAFAPRQGADLPGRDPGSALLTVRALPGTALAFSDGTKATVGPEGTAEVTLAVPAAYKIRAARAGFTSVQRSFFLQSDRELAIEQPPVPRLSVDASLLVCWPALAVSFFPVPERVFVRAGVTTYLLGIVLRPDEVFSSDPVTNIDILGGMYLGPAFAAARAYAGVGGFLRFVHAPGWPMRLEPLAPAGLQAAIGMEIPLGSSARFFAEVEPMLYATASPQLLRSTQSSGVGWVYLDRGALDLLSARIGMRWLR